MGAPVWGWLHLAPRGLSRFLLYPGLTPWAHLCRPFGAGGRGRDARAYDEIIAAFLLSSSFCRNWFLPWLRGLAAWLSLLQRGNRWVAVRDISGMLRRCLEGRPFCHPGGWRRRSGLCLSNSKRRRDWDRRQWLYR